MARYALPLLLATLLAAGCAALPPSSGPARAPQGSGAPTREVPPEAARPAPSRAATSLLDQARTERASGRLAQAAATVERALTIEPNDPVLWLELGEIRREQGDPGQAEVMARKALTLAAGDAAIERRAARLID